MAGEIPPLNITVNLETSGVQTGVNQATASIKNISAAAEGAGSKFTGLKTVMLGTFASSAIQKGLSEFEGFLKESVKAAEAAQTSVAALGTAMNNAKVNTDANREAIMKSTEAMGSLGFQANDTRNAFTKMVTATGSVTESTRLMSVAADYARLKHEDLTTAAATLTRGTTGAMRAFREFGITLDTTLPKNEAISKAFDQLNQKIGGQAAAYAQTYAGKMQIIGVQTEDLKEKIGNLLLPILTKLESWFIGSLKWLSNHKAVMEAIALVVGTVLLAVIVNTTVALYAQAAAWVTANLPMLAIIATIGLVVAGFVKLWNSSETFRKVVVDALKLVIDAFGYLVGAIGKVIEAATHLPFIGGHFKGIADAVNGAAKDIGGFSSKLDGLSNKKIDIKFPNIKDALATAGGKSSSDSVDITGLVPGGSIDKGAAKAAAAAKKQADALVKAQAEMTKLQTDYETVLKDRQDKMDAAAQTRDDKKAAALESFNNTVDDITKRHDEAYASAQQSFDDSVAAAHQAHDEKITQIDADYAQKKIDLLDSYNTKVADLQQKAADTAIQIEQQGVDKRKSIIQQSIDVMTNAWNGATKIDLGTLFTSGGSTGAGLADSLKTQLDKILQLQKDAGNLSAQGYSQSFINQVIAKGPEVGDQMAQAVLSATPETAAQIKALYGQIDTVSQNGLDQLAQTMNDGTQFATQAMAQQYAQVAVEIRDSLAQNSANLQDSLTKENASYQAALDAATDAHTKATAAAELTLTNALATAQLRLTEAQTKADQAQKDAMATAQRTLDASLLSAQTSYETAIKAISDSTDKQLTALMAKIDAAATKIQSLGGTVSGIGSSFNGVYSSTAFGVDTSNLAGILKASGGSSSTTPGSPPQVVINAPIAVDGSTAPVDIQSKLLSMAKFGLVAM